MDGAKEVAASLATRAGDWSADRLRTAAEEPAGTLLVQVRQEAARAGRANQIATRIAWLMAGTATVTLAAWTRMTGLQNPLN